MLENPSEKYNAFPPLHLPNRKWPDRTLTKAPRWLSTDLRDGNQALINPMDGDAKLRYYKFLLELGYKEIEISYPSASQTEWDFTRKLITEGLIPDDVTIQVMAPCREDLIRTTIESARGAKKVILHIHVSTSDCFREVVFNLSEREMIDLAVRNTALIRSLTKDSRDPEMAATEWTLEFTPENFQDTSVSYALSICEAVKAAWAPTPENQIIFNLTSTVEVAMPNMFADQVEFFCDHITERDKVCVSLHNHNDRGCAVATAELSQLAGADRVEGCLFGNGERTGNVDLVTLALNLYTQGVHPGLDFGDINSVVDLVEELTEIPVHFRAPYAGKFVFCTFTGTHQDAIRKGYKKREAIEKKLGRSPKWRIPFLPMDPHDLGRKHEAIIRLNAQSGKGGIAWYVNDVFGIDMPRELEVAFTKIVKAHANRTRSEVTHDMIEDLFREHYMLADEAEVDLHSCALTEREVHVHTNGHVNGHTNGHTNGTNGHTNGYSNGHTNGHANGSTNGNTNGYTNGHTNHTNGHTNGTNGHTNGYTNGTNGTDAPTVSMEAQLAIKSVSHEICGFGCDPWASIMNAVQQLGLDLELLDQKVQLIEGIEDPTEPQRAACFVKIAAKDRSSPLWGVGIDEDPLRASLQAILSTVDKVRTEVAV